MSDGHPDRAGRVAAYLHRDQINGEVRARRGARLAALTSGGAIPETGDYRVLAEPDDTFIGTVNEDWAIESSAGDIFLLGSTSWKIRRVVAGTVRVVDAHGAPPSVPFWLGEAPARTEELSREVSDLRSGVEALLAEGGADEAITWVEQRAGVDNDVASMVVRYLAAGRTALGVVPTLEHIVLERFFDDSGGMQLVVHAPFGGRVNRALGLALRKRFCATFDFELQAAASDDCVLLSLGPQHSFPLEDIPKFLSSNTVEEVLRKAAIFAPMWAVRWRWNLNRSLTVLRFKGGRKNPAPIQRLESDDIMGAVFPQLVACQNENPTGPVEAPDHPLVNQTMYDCLHEVMDVDSLRELVLRIERKEVEISFRDTVEPSPLAHEIVNGRPYTFLDDAPLEERRSRAITLRRGLPVEARDLAALDPDAIARVRGEAAPDPRDHDELHDLLVALVVTRPVPAWTALVRRAGRTRPGADGHQGRRRLLVRHGARRERRGALAGRDARAASGGAAAHALRPRRLDGDALVASILRGHLEVSGPMTADALSRSHRVASRRRWRSGSLRSRATGSSIRGHFDPGISDEQWCARRLLVRIHGYTQQRLRQEIEPVTAQDFVRFLLRWQRVAPGTQREGRAGVAATIAQLQGFEIPAGVWEETVLPSRVSGYRSAWLDELCMSGEVAWARLKVRDEPARAAAVAKQLIGIARHPGDAGHALRPAVAAAVGARRGATARARVGRDARCARSAARARRALHQRHRHARAPAARVRSRTRSGMASRVACSPPTVSVPSAACWSAAGSGAHDRTTADSGTASAATRRAKAAGRWCRACHRWPSTTRSPRRSPSSCWCAGEWCFATSSRARRSRCRGAMWCGRCVAWKRAAPRAAVASSPASPVSSSRCRKPLISCAACAVASARRKWCACRPPIR